MIAAGREDAPGMKGPPMHEAGPAPAAGRSAGGWRRLWPVALLAAGLAAFLALGLDRYLSFQALAEHREALLALVAANAALAALGFVLAYAAAVALSVPGASVLTLAAGFLFGTALGTAYAVLGATVGAVGVFLAARSA